MSTDSADPQVRNSRLLAWLQLCRAPNVFTALADVAMGFLVANAARLHGELWEPVGGLVCLLLASALLYTAGMVLNDVYDYEVDARERPARPLPSGRISRSRAQRVGYAMLIGGVALGWLAALVVETTADPIWRSGAVATLLAVCVVGYDAVFKKTVAGPLLMGLCRFLNVLLGMSLTAVGALTPFGWDASHLLVAGGIGVYIVGVTWFARTEARESNRALLILGVVLMAAGVAMLAVFPRFDTVGVRQYFLEQTWVWPAALFLLTFSILRRCLVAVAYPSPPQVQAAVKHCILSLIVLDAAVCLMVAGPLAVLVLALLAPTLLLGKWVYST